MQSDISVDNSLLADAKENNLLGGDPSLEVIWWKSRPTPSDVVGCQVPLPIHDRRWEKGMR